MSWFVSPLTAISSSTSSSSSPFSSRSSNGNVRMAAIPPSPSNRFPLSCSLLNTRTSPPSTPLTLSTKPTHLLLTPTSCALNSASEINNTPPPLPIAPLSAARSTSCGPYHALPSSFRKRVRNSVISRVSRAYFVFLSRARTSGDWSTSLSEWRCPDDEWTTMKLGFWASKALSPALVAVSMMYFKNAAAVKPGLARRIGFDSVMSICRTRVSNVVWKNLARPYENCFSFEQRCFSRASPFARSLDFHSPCRDPPIFHPFSSAQPSQLSVSAQFLIPSILPHSPAPPA